MCSNDNDDYGYFVEYGRDQTDEEDDLPSGQHTMHCNVQHHQHVDL